MPIDYSSVFPGNSIAYSGGVVGYIVGPGMVQPDYGDGAIRILWVDEFSFSVLPPGHTLLADLSLSSP